MSTPRRLLVSLLSALLLFGGSASGAPSTQVIKGPGPGGFASDNVEWLGFVPLTMDSPGARVHGKYFYITTSYGLTIYDVSDPIAPVRTGFLPLPQQPYYAEEDVDTNGDIVLISTISDLYVINVEDKANPTIVGQLAGAEQHTWTCVLDCTWAYGSEGMIADLRDPSAPKEAGKWGDGKPTGSGHDVTEVKRGWVVTSTQPIMLLDARKDPAKPKLVAVGANDDQRFIHSNVWPRAMKDKFLLVGGETLGPKCDGESSGKFMTWDASKWKKTRTFTMIDEYKVTNGLPTDGNAPANLFCTHWFEADPKFKNGGTVAMGWYEHGTRFFDISSKGKISEAGYFIPFAGSTSAAYWITDEILYTADYNRGIDIIRYSKS